MKSLQDYIDIYRGIANKLNITGDSVEILSQMLANASFISEVENIAYTQEASLEKSTLINSKIQHCVDDMYSVFRGSCPRVILNIKPTKYLSFNIYDEIISSNSFKAYYLGYYDKNYTRPGGYGNDKDKLPKNCHKVFVYLYADRVNFNPNAGLIFDYENKYNKHT